MTDPSTILRGELARVNDQLAALAADRDRIVVASMESNADDEHDPEGATIAFEREQVTALIAQTERTRAHVHRLRGVSVRRRARRRTCSERAATSLPASRGWRAGRRARCPAPLRGP